MSLRAMNTQRNCLLVTVLALAILYLVHEKIQWYTISQVTNRVTGNGPTYMFEKQFTSTGSINTGTKNGMGLSKTMRPFHIKMERKENFDYKAAMQELNEEKVAADDRRLVELIRNYYILPPSELEYNLTHPHQTDASAGQAPFVDNRLNYKEYGFFVECGGLDGEKRSNSLLFERYRGWNGVIIEADPLNFANLVQKRRKAYAINACLNVQPYPSMVTFKQAENVGRIAEGDGQGLTTEVQCFPLYSILLAMNQLNVDFFSLDVEGDELKVLQTIPFEKVNIKMMAVEYVHQTTGSDSLKNFVESKGYKTLLQMSAPTGYVNDLIFMK